MRPKKKEWADCWEICEEEKWLNDRSIFSWQNLSFMFIKKQEQKFSPMHCICLIIFEICVFPSEISFFFPSFLPLVDNNDGPCNCFGMCVDKGY